MIVCKYSNQKLIVHMSSKQSQVVVRWWVLLTGGGGGQGAAGLLSKVSAPLDLLIPKCGLSGHQQTDDSRHLLPTAMWTWLMLLSVCSVLWGWRMDTRKERLQSDLILWPFNPRNDYDKQNENLWEGRLPQCRCQLLSADGMETWGG